MIALESVDALQTLLGSAMRVIDELRNERLLERLVGVLGCMLPEDREPIIRILEHDAGPRARLGEDNMWSRFMLRPNPFAQLYTRTNSGARSPELRYLEARRATVVGARLARSLQPWGEGGWAPETRDVWRRLSADERAYVVGMSRRVLGVLERNRRRGSHV
jgi:hypothetical protein